MKHIVYPLLLAVGIALLQGCATTGQPGASAATDDERAYLEMLRSDLNSTKVRTLNQVMKLTGPEAEKFWPVYQAYEKELAELGGRKLALIREFAGHHTKGTLDDSNAKTIASNWLRLVQDRVELWNKYHQRISDAVSPVRAAQFLQVEHQIALFIDLSIASEMPLVGSSLEPK